MYILDFGPKGVMEKYVSCFLVYPFLGVFIFTLKQKKGITG